MENPRGRFMYLISALTVRAASEFPSRATKAHKRTEMKTETPTRNTFDWNTESPL